MKRKAIIMKKTILKCCLSFVLSIILVLGMIPMGNAKVVEAAESGVLVIKASELSDNRRYVHDGCLRFNNNCDINFTNRVQKVNLIMDVDAEYFKLDCAVDLTISGTKTLTIGDRLFRYHHYIDCDGSLYLEKDVNIKINGDDGRISSDKNIYSEANVTFGQDFYSYGISAPDGIYVKGGSIDILGDGSSYLLYSPSGNISVKNANINVKKVGTCFYCSKDVSISGSSVRIDECSIFAGISNYDRYTDHSNMLNRDINIDNSNISCNTSSITIAKNITINGGNSSFAIDDSSDIDENVFFCESFAFNGGTLSLSSMKCPIKTPENGIKLGENCYVSTPEGGSIQSNGAYDYIADADGNEVNTVVLSKDTVSNGGDDSGSNNGGNNSGNDGNAGNAGNDGNNDNTQKYCNEWVDGRWYNADGVCDYEGILSWKCNSTGWWVEDTLGWYPQSQWQKIDGKWYYFLDTGYMDYSEYRDGYWLGSGGAWVEDYYGGHWCSDSNGWWYEDASGWYPTSQWLWIDGKCYYFEADGYLATNKYIDGYWVGLDGAY